MCASLVIVIIFHLSFSFELTGGSSYYIEVAFEPVIGSPFSCKVPCDNSVSTSCHDKYGINNFQCTATVYYMFNITLESSDYCTLATTTAPMRSVLKQTWTVLSHALMFCIDNVCFFHYPDWTVKFIGLSDRSTVTCTTEAIQEKSGHWTITPDHTTCNFPSPIPSPYSMLSYSNYLTTFTTLEIRRGDCLGSGFNKNDITVNPDIATAVTIRDIVKKYYG